MAYPSWNCRPTDDVLIFGKFLKHKTRFPGGFYAKITPITMKILSWNVNGLRAIERKGHFEDLLNLGADIICLQEVKAQESQLSEKVREPKAYPHRYFSHPNEKKGYSGVAVYSKIPFEEVNEGPKKIANDKEGRVLAAHFSNTVLFNVYFPNGGGGPKRLKYKLDFYDTFLKEIEKLNKKGKKIIFCGDVNTAHEEIDLARPKENKTNTGFLPEERAWLDEVVNKGYVDVFRNLNPEKKEIYTYWDMKSRARDRNVGWRIDYFFVSQDLLKKIKGFKTLSNFFGSDHCPIVLEVDIK